MREIAIDPIVETNAAPAGADPAERVGLIDLANALAGLDLDDRTVVGMRYAVGMSSTEIGLAIGMTAGGVRARIARLLLRLRKDLGDA